MNIQLTTDDKSFNFFPVRVTRGRKWRGELAYYISSNCSSFQLYGWTGRGGHIYTETAKLWEPVSKKYVYANADFVEDVEQDPAKTCADKAEYIKATIESTLAWCHQVY